MKILLVLIASCSSLACMYAQDTMIYSLVSADMIKGFYKIWKNPEGSFESWYQFNDRGRGDSLRVKFLETEDGFPTYMKAGGVDYMKSPVFEEFALENNIATWKNPGEEGSEEINEKKFYSALKFESGHLIKALHVNHNKIKLLPYGEIEMEELEKHTLSNGLKSIELTLVAIKGQTYTPYYAWIDGSYQEFASINEWMSSIRKGYEPAIKELLAIQKKYELNYFKQAAATFPEHDKSILIRNVSVFNAREAKMEYHKDVFISAGMITSIVKTQVSVPDNVHVIEGKGMTLLPALWDMHTHTSDIMEGILHMACGVTHIRDMGNSELILEKQKQFETGELIGPRIEVISGLIDGSGPLAAPIGALINSLEEGLQAVNDFAKKGYQQIKIYSSVNPDWVKPLADEAHKKNLRVCGHIPAFMTATEAINNGYDEITHMNMLALNFFGDTIDTRSPLRFSIPAQRTAKLDLESSEFVQFMQLLKEKNIAIDPTLAIFEDLFMAQDKVVSPTFASSVDHFPLQVQRYLKAGGGGLPATPEMSVTHQQSFKAFQQILKKAYDQGIRILPGTDAYPGFSLFRELSLYVEAGIPSEKVLQFATWNNAVYTGTTASYGSIEVGKKADLILVEGDPVKNIDNIRNTRLVITNNRIYEPNKLFAAISIAPF